VLLPSGSLLGMGAGLGSTREGNLISSGGLLGFEEIFLPGDSLLGMGLHRLCSDLSCLSLGAYVGPTLFRVEAYSGGPFKGVGFFRVAMTWRAAEASCVRAAAAVLLFFRNDEFSPCQRYSSDGGRVGCLVRGGVRRLVREIPGSSRWSIKLLL